MNGIAPPTRLVTKELGGVFPPQPIAVRRHVQVLLSTHPFRHIIEEMEPLDIRATIFLFLPIP
jgi:hypothetical protein